jgi:hypothetical protein
MKPCVVEHRSLYPPRQLFPMMSSPSSDTDTEEDNLILKISSDEGAPVEATIAAPFEELECLEDSIAFLDRIQHGIYFLGWELGFLVQASTVDIQYVATSFIFDRPSQLLLSFLWSYTMALIALVIFFLCQKAIHAFMMDILVNHSNSNDDKYRFLLEEWKVELKCRFVHGSLLGVLCSWVFLDVLMSFRIRVIYGGILFLASLLLFSARIWHAQQQQHHCQQQKRTGEDTSFTSPGEEELDDSTVVHQGNSMGLLCILHGVIERRRVVLRELDFLN